MLSVEIPRKSFLRRLLTGKVTKKPKVIALFSYRYDKHLVPDLLENLSPVIDGWISWDDTQRTDLWYDEGEIRQRLIKTARESGADWVLCVDPDERYEASLYHQMPDLIAGDRFRVWGFPFKELYEVDAYRVDGIWNEKSRWNLFALNDEQVFRRMHVHSPWHPQNPEYTLKLTDINLYHLKMIDPKNRTDRANLYKEVDQHGIQDIGYDYLIDEAGIELRKISREKMYAPFRPVAPKIRQNEWVD